MTVLRSLLFCPATEPAKVRKIPNYGADAAAIDLEDAVSDDQKTYARDLAFELVSSELFAANNVYVRVNSMGTGRTLDDVAAVVHPNLKGIVLPKTDDAESVAAVDDALNKAEAQAGIAKGSIKILPLIETALGVHRAVDIFSASPRVEAGIFGFVDYMLDVGIHLIDHTPDAHELLYARSSLVNSSRAAGITPPLDGPFLGIKSPDAFLAQCRQARTLGYRGKMLIHPTQVKLAHEGFAPSPQEIVQAENIVRAFAEVEDQGVAALMVDGRLVDYPIVYRAENILKAVNQ
ncbi:HpcH/HpaI aldolase/citrate lyase family protein [Arthrobacter sp. NPDC093139]|uniref:HpcH/HpaI aldolase/citrate lyase family protein n=1 Tax=Arthrobacter sp. NPDC093139 TaxID=3363945 RepID=UPI003808FE1F